MSLNNFAFPEPCRDLRQKLRNVLQYQELLQGTMTEVTGSCDGSHSERRTTGFPRSNRHADVGIKDGDVLHFRVDPTSYRVPRAAGQEKFVPYSPWSCRRLIPEKNDLQRKTSDAQLD